MSESEQVNVKVTMWHQANTALANDLSSRVLSGKDFPPPGNPAREEMAKAAYRRKMGIKNLGEGFDLRVSDTEEPVSEPVESNAAEIMADFRMKQEHAKVDPLVKAVAEAVKQAQGPGAISADDLARAVAAGVTAALGQPVAAPAQPEAPRPDSSQSQGSTMSRKQR